MTLSETYNTLLEAELQRRLGVRFAARPRRRGRQAGGPRAGRRRPGAGRALVVAVERDRVAPRVLASDFQRRFGRPPTAGGGDRAEPAGHPRDPAGQARRRAARQEQRRAWRAEAEAVLGSPAAVDAMVEPGDPARPAPGERSCERRREPTVRRCAADAVRGAGWTTPPGRSWRSCPPSGPPGRSGTCAPRPNARSAAPTWCRPTDLARHRRPARSAPRSRPLHHHRRPGPAALPRRHPRAAAAVRRRVGLPAAWRPSLHLGRRRPRRAAAAGRGAPHRRPRRPPRRRSAAIAAATAPRRPAGQRAAQPGPRAAHLGRRLQLALAPAGTGKTTAMGVLADAWRRCGGQVLGLAPVRGRRPAAGRGSRRSRRDPGQARLVARAPTPRLRTGWSAIGAGDRWWSIDEAGHGRPPATSPPW